MLADLLAKKREDERAMEHYTLGNRCKCTTVSSTVSMVLLVFVSPEPGPEERIRPGRPPEAGAVAGWRRGSEHDSGHIKDG